MEYRTITKSICFRENSPVGSNVQRISAAKHENRIVSTSYFIATAVGGGVSTALTRISITPLDVVKCRMQVDTTKYSSFFNGLVVTFKKEGLHGLFGGWAPLALGYGLRGASNYGIYEFSKQYLAQTVGEDKAHKYRSIIYFSSAIAAEVVGDVILAPFENAKIRSQTDPTAPRQMRRCMAMIYNEGGVTSMFKGLTPLLMRQIPIVITKFMGFEFAAENIYKHVRRKDREQCNISEQVQVTVGASCASGIACAFISNPADVWVSLMCSHKDLGLKQAIRKAVFRPIWYGFPVRRVAGTYIIVLQFIAVEFTKNMFNNKRV